MESTTQAVGNTKKLLLIHLKKNGDTSLKDLSTSLSITKMGVLKHIAHLEEQGLVERIYKKSGSGKGRPKLFIHLTEKSIDAFPKAYSSISTHALQFIEEKLGESGVKEVLQNRAKMLEKDYQPEFEGKQLKEKVRVLMNIRNDDGYMAEFIENEKSFFLDEYNCPIFEVAQAYGQACSAERVMFQNLLGTKIDTTHRVVAGDNVCRFSIRKE